MRDVVVVGGGIAGLVAAHDLARGGLDVLVVEGSPQIGGKLRQETVAGCAVDVGAEAMLARRPEGIEFAAELGVDLAHPTGARSQIWSRGALRPMPRSLMGVPFDLADLAVSGILSEEGLARARQEKAPTDLAAADISVGDLIAARLGDELVDRLVEPLLGGVYAGHARELSTAAAVPQLLAMARRGPLLDHTAAATPSDAPVFATVPGGMGRLPDLVVAAGGFEVRTSTALRRIRRAGPAWELEVGSAASPQTLTAQRIVLATPAAPTARLLGEVAPEAASELAEIDSASVAVITHAFRATDIPDALADVSGFLVPPVEGRAIKASTFSFAKWAWVRDLDPDLLVLRTSLGRHREEATLQAPDEALVRLSLSELAALAGITADPVDSHVQRWGGGLPQYAVGHVERIARVREAIGEVAGLEVCGAAYDGVGIPAVIGSARRAAVMIAGA